MSRWALALAWVFLVQTPLAAQQLGELGKLSNSAVSAPLGQGLDLVHSAEPLGQDRFRLRVMNRSSDMLVPELGAGRSYTGGYGISYGLRRALDVSLMVPFLLDSVDGLNKYGTGDPAVGVKWSTPGRAQAGSHRAVQLLLGLPLGYKGEHGLDQVGGVRAFSTGALDVGLQVLQDLHFRHVSVYLNGGYFRSGNVDALPQLVYGIGLETGRSNRWVSLNAEYLSRVAFAQESRAAGVLKMGARLKVYRGIELEINRERGFLDWPTRSLFTVGLRMHGYLTGVRRLEARSVLYRPPPRPERVYQPSEVLRVAVVEFSGFEDYKAGKRLVERIKAQLAPHDSLEVVELRRYLDVPHKGYLKPDQALDLARKLGVDVVLTGHVTEYQMDRFAGLHVPYVFYLPEAQAHLSLRYRVMEFFDPQKTEMQTFSGTISGLGQTRKRVRLLPVDRRDITAAANAGELQLVQEAALDNLVDNLLASMAVQFTWVPPSFQP